MRFRTEVKHQVENNGNRDVWRKTVLWQAFGFKPVDLEVIQFLIEQGADVNGDRCGEETVLFEAVRSGSMNGVKFLVEHCDADVNYQQLMDSCDYTALAVAVEYQWLDIIKYLIEHGSDLTLEITSNLFTMFWNNNLAIRRSDPENKYCYISDLSSEDSDKKSARLLNNQYSLGFNIFLLAVEKNSVDLVKLLIKKGIDAKNAKKVFVDGEEMSLVEWSIYLGHDDITNILTLEMKRSVKHREKLELLETMNVNQLSETEVPMDIFAADERLQIGKGSIGTSVYVGIMNDGSEVAVKRMFTKFCGVSAQNEREVLNLIGTTKSPYIVNYRNFHEDSNFMFLIVDLCEENLKEHVNAHSIQYLKQQGPRMIKEILTGLEVLHDQGILHRDLKPANVLVDIEGRMKLADFGISRVLDEDETTFHTEARGTTGWMAAEVIEAINSEAKSRYKKKSDIQVTGMLAHFILSRGEHPFGPSLDRMGNIVRGKAVFLKSVKERSARQFVSWLINHNIDKRPFVREALEHAFLKTH